MDALNKSEIFSSDFDRIALLPADGWSHNTHYYSWIEQQLPPQAGRILDIGCGTGELCRRMAAPARSIEGLDFSRNMIIRARQMSKDYPDIHYRLGDFMATDFEEPPYDFIFSVATPHLNPLEPFLQKANRLLKPGGRLLIVDLYQEARFTDYLLNILAAPVSLLFRLIYNGRLRHGRAHREAWKAHSANDQLMEFNQIQAVAQQILPGCQLERKFFFRYSLLWDKPNSTNIS